MDEFSLIDRYLRPLAAHEAALHLRDDAALFTPPPGTQWVITKDALVEGVHFIGNEPPATIAQKLLRVNLSDLAAKGAEPYAYLLALMLPEHTDEAWIADFCRGLAADQQAFDIALAGGDTVATPGPLALSLTMLGTLPHGQALLRSGARAGDDVWISGMLGDGALGLHAVRGELDSLIPPEDIAYLIERYRLPEPRLPLGQALRGMANACMDISDGLVQDAGHLAKASSVKIIVDSTRIPFSEASFHAIQAKPELGLQVLVGGDDYELLFTAPSTKRENVEQLAERLSLYLTRIGQVTAGQGVELLDDRGQPMQLEKQGYRHFRKESG